MMVNLLLLLVVGPLLKTAAAAAFEVNNRGFVFAKLCPPNGFRARLLLQQGGRRRGEWLKWGCYIKVIRDFIELLQSDSGKWALLFNVGKLVVVI